MTSHRDCTHPRTKAARAKCRKRKAQNAADLVAFEVENQIYHDTYIRPYQEQEAARQSFEAECEKFCEAHISSAHQNADDTSVEEGFAPNSKRWYETAISTLHHARDTADRLFDLKDPEKGQYVSYKLDDGDREDDFWIADIKYLWDDRGNLRYPDLTLINREGTKFIISAAQLIDRD